jgi:hypothetical protein
VNNSVSGFGALTLVFRVVRRKSDFSEEYLNILPLFSGSTNKPSKIPAEAGDRRYAPLKRRSWGTASICWFLLAYSSTPKMETISSSETSDCLRIKTQKTVLFITSYLYLINKEAVPVASRGSPLGFETSRLPHFLDNRLKDGDEVVSVTRPSIFTSRKIPATHFYYGLNGPQGPLCGWKYLVNWNIIHFFLCHLIQFLNSYMANNKLVTHFSG